MFALIKAFIAGFVATLAFQQGMLWLLDQLRLAAAPVWSMAPTPWLGVPYVLALACWGGVWGVLLWLLVRRTEAAGYYVGTVLLGALLPTAVWLVVLPLVRGTSPIDLVSGLTVARLAVALAVNGSYGLGLAILMRILQPPR